MAEQARLVGSKMHKRISGIMDYADRYKYIGMDNALGSLNYNCRAEVLYVVQGIIKFY